MAEMYFQVTKNELMFFWIAPYYRVTENMRRSLRLDSMLDSNYDFICGFHFPDTSFDKSGRLIRDSIPAFFPSRESLKHDHDYICNAEEAAEITGKHYVD